MLYSLDKKAPNTALLSFFNCQIGEAKLRSQQLGGMAYSIEFGKQLYLSGNTFKIIIRASFFYETGFILSVFHMSKISKTLITTSIYNLHFGGAGYTLPNLTGQVMCPIICPGHASFMSLKRGFILIKQSLYLLFLNPEKSIDSSFVINYK